MSKYITRESQKIFTLQKQALESRCKELEASKELLESKLSTLESSLANVILAYFDKTTESYAAFTIALINLAPKLLKSSSAKPST